MRNYVICGIVLSLLIPMQVIASFNTHRIGQAFVVNYPTTVYQSGRQVWDICEGSEGLMYFATGPLLESGHNYWKVHDLSAGSPTRSLCAMPGNNLLVGGPGMFGIMKQTDLPGQRAYQSLMGLLDSTYHDFGSVWQILEKGDDYYARAGRAVLKYAGDTIVPLVYGDLTEYIQFLGDSLFIQLARKGLYAYAEDKLVMLPFGDYFSRMKVVGLFRYAAAEFLIFTAEDGVFVTDGDRVHPYTPLDLKSFRENQISVVVPLASDIFAIGTIKDGVFVVNWEGTLIQHINRKSGLQNNTIISMKSDSNNNLWLGLDNGISYIELNSCLSSISSDIDIGTGYVSKYFRGNMYFGTNQGLFYAPWNINNPEQNRRLQIRPVPQTTGQVWTLFESDGRLFCGHHKGLFEIRDGNSFEVGEMEGCWQIDFLDQNNNYYLVSTYRGFYLVQFQDHGFVRQIRLENIPSNPRVFMQDDKGYFWIVTPEQRIFRFRINIDNPGIASSVEDMTDRDGLKPFSSIRLVGNKRQVFFSTENGLYTYDNSRQSFVANILYNQIIETGEMCFELFEDDFSRVWYGRSSEMGFFPLHFGNTSKTYLPFNKILDSYTRVFGKINVVDAKNVLFGVENGFYHYHSSCLESNNIVYKAYIADVIISDSPVRWTLGGKGISQTPVFRHNRNAFEFFFTSNFFETKRNVHYSFWLEGYDETWSDWQTRNSRGFSNLFEGTYTLHVRAQSVGGFVTKDASYTFVVLPPFYRSTIAWIIYFILLAVAFAISRFFILRHLKKEKHKVEIQKQLELEQRRKEYEAEQLIAKQRITELENESLHQDLMHKSKELSNSMINLIHMNDNLRKIKADVQQMQAEKDDKKRENLTRGLLRFVNNEISKPKYMELFDLNFSAVHEEFINSLQEKFPQLSQNDIKLCAFLKMNKSTKEIASLMNISVRGVETSRHRLRKKVGLSRDENLFNFLASI